MAFTTLDSQIYRSERVKWLNHQKKVANSIVDSMEKTKKAATYSLMKYGSQATMEVSFLSPKRDIKSSIERISEPQGKGNVEAALKTAVDQMFAIKDRNDKESNIHKTMILFIEKEANEKMSETALDQARKLRNHGVTILAVVMGGDVKADDGKVDTEGAEALVGKQGRVVVVRDLQKNPLFDFAETLDKLKKKGLVFFYTLLP